MNEQSIWWHGLPPFAVVDLKRPWPWEIKSTALVVRPEMAVVVWREDA